MKIFLQKLNIETLKCISPMLLWNIIEGIFIVYIAYFLLKSKWIFISKSYDELISLISDSLNKIIESLAKRLLYQG
jgi:hypothetical protein